ncbi:DUF6415 family natural product biosynthesis protein [Streptomyces sp. NBC_00996]|uniref:DUF6415 family natural product biosynthesis protein n=1 Tax=Streptomyces sp. NBC_00996 TaxID=2903710 RepID=UPI003869CD67|nr:DUF6415 family natural product biosynthesis protein [Streptomyces sp. NBC_00996]
MTGTVETDSDTGVPDIDTMHETIDRLLNPDAVPEVLPPTAEELETLTSLLRGHLDLLMPEVERAAAKLAKNSIPRYCALACLGEARQRLAAQPSPAPGGDVSYARRLARALNALVDHFESLSRAEP